MASRFFTPSIGTLTMCLAVCAGVLAAADARRPTAAAAAEGDAARAVIRQRADPLAVDTTNFTERTNFRGSPQTSRQDVFATERVHVTERFTPLDRDTIRYQFTVDDPDTWTMPRSGEMMIRRMEGPLYEYACHEGNTACRIS
jgi:hypothetical protein